jgi:hypothetical protein
MKARIIKSPLIALAAFLLFSVNTLKAQRDTLKDTLSTNPGMLSDTTGIKRDTSMKESPGMLRDTSSIKRDTSLQGGGTGTNMDTTRNNTTVPGTGLGTDTLRRSDTSTIGAPVIVDRTDETRSDYSPPEQEPEFNHGEFGLRYLPTFSRFDFNTSSGGTVRGEVSVSHGYGIMLGGNFNEHVGIMGEVNYYESAQKYKDQELEREVRLSYINIPVLLQLNTDKSAPLNFNFVAGPQFGFNAGSSLSTTEGRDMETVKAVVAVKAGDVGLAYGAGIEAALNKERTFRLDLGFRGFYGLVDISSNKRDANTYNVLIKAARQTYSGYLGLAVTF